jgi:hypothetical protein
MVEGIERVVGTPQPGQRVRAVIEGVCREANGEVYISSEDVPAVALVSVPGVRAASVEVLPDPQPAWWPPQAGDVVAAPGFSSPLVRGRAPQWIDIDGGTADDDELLAACRHNQAAHQLLVRGGKPYQEPKRQVSIHDGSPVSRETLDWPQ